MTLPREPTDRPGMRRSDPLISSPANPQTGWQLRRCDDPREPTDGIITCTRCRLCLIQESTSIHQQAYRLFVLLTSPWFSPQNVIRIWGSTTPNFEARGGFTTNCVNDRVTFHSVKSGGEFFADSRQLCLFAFRGRKIEMAQFLIADGAFHGLRGRLARAEKSGTLLFLCNFGPLAVFARAWPSRPQWCLTRRSWSSSRGKRPGDQRPDRADGMNIGEALLSASLYASTLFSFRRQPGVGRQAPCAASCGTSAHSSG